MFDHETYGFLGSSDCGNKTLIVGDTETPVDMRERKGGFQHREKWPEETLRRTDGCGFCEPSAPHRCTSLWMRFISAESHVPVCVEVSV